MQNVSIPAVGQTEKTRYAYFFIILLLLMSAVSIYLMKMMGLMIACSMLIGVIIVPFYYNKPHIFLLFSVLIQSF